jgi:viroplasmin and RNaseH domain-containing protein
MKKFYVVFVGRKPGVYLSWEDCHPQVDRFPGNLHKSYRSYHEAEHAFAEFHRKNNAITGSVNPFQAKPEHYEQMKAAPKDHALSIKYVVLVIVFATIVVVQAYLLYRRLLLNLLL